MHDFCVFIKRMVARLHLVPRGGKMLELKFIIVAIFSFAVGLMNGCYPPKQIELSMQHNGQEVKLRKGQILVITLEGNPTTGYTWAVAEPTDILRQVGEIKFKPQSDMLGAGGVQIIKFEALKAGETTLNLVYHRPWEKGVEPLKTFSINVFVR